MIEPILDLDEALESELVREREMVVTYEQPEIGRDQAARLPDQALADSGADRAAGAGARRAHGGGAGEAGYSEEEIQALEESGAAKGARTLPQQAGAVPGMSGGEGPEASRGATRVEPATTATRCSGWASWRAPPGVSAATIKHYLREGLLPEPVKTSRNMAYYPAEFVERIRMIKQLQEERYMPLRVIKDLLEEDPDRARALIELGDQLLEHALAGESERISAAEVRHRYDVPQDVLDRLAELEVLTPDSKGYSPSDVRIIEAISRFRAGGYEERIGFTVYDTLRYKEAMAELVKQEVDVLMERLAGEMDPDEAMALIEAGNQPLNDLLAAMHTKALVAELERRRGSEPRLERRRRAK